MPSRIQLHVLSLRNCSLRYLQFSVFALAIFTQNCWELLSKQFAGANVQFRRTLGSLGCLGCGENLITYWWSQLFCWNIHYFSFRGLIGVCVRFSFRNHRECCRIWIELLESLHIKIIYKSAAVLCTKLFLNDLLVFSKALLNFNQLLLFLFSE